MKKTQFRSIEREIKKKKVLFNIYFDYKFNLDTTFIEPDLPEDAEERIFCILNIKKIVEKLKTDKYDRQCCFTITYDGFFAKCPSLIHIYKENKKLSMNVYIRSWNYLKNFNYDIQTFNLLLSLVSKELNLMPNKITFISHSLHLDPSITK